MMQSIALKKISTGTGLLALLFLVCCLCVQHRAAAQQQQYPSRFVVAPDGTGDFTTIQQAINAVRDLSQQQVTIYIKNSTYREKLVVPSYKTNIRLQGESTNGVVITNSDHTGKAFPGTDLLGRDKYMTFTSYTLLVQGNDFVAENLTIENAAGSVGQAVALHVEGDRAIIKNCRLLGDQDTLYTATSTSRQYYLNCYIEGTTDFIFGEATAVFDSCIIHSKRNSYITAASTRPGQAYGYVLRNCRLTADSNVNKVYLGRPWRPYAQTVYINTYMGSHILAEGWDNWRNAENEKTAFYAEYNSSGPGANPAGRVQWAKKLSKKEAARYTLANIFAQQTQWVPGKN